MPAAEPITEAESLAATLAMARGNRQSQAHPGGRPSDEAGHKPEARSGGQPGDKIGRYLLLEALGAGGMGVVYAAYDPELDRKVAIKIRHPGRRRDKAHARLLREAQALARLSHANVVAVHDVGSHDGQVFVAMEFIAGRTLAEVIEAGDAEPAALLRLFRGAGKGLAAAHRAGLVHRDFKP